MSPQGKPPLPKGISHVLQRIKRRKPSISDLVLCVVIVLIITAAFVVFLKLDKESTSASEERDVAARFTVSSGDVQLAKDKLAQLPIKGKGPKTGYSRDQFGRAWTDDVDVVFGKNGCSTRDDILTRDLTEVTKKGKCQVVSGRLWDPYTGKVIPFTRGKTTSSKVQIDHVVALGNVWISGGSQLSPLDRKRIANDPINLIAVDGPTNGAKGDRNAAEWLPPYKNIRCFYAASQIQVKHRYGLSVTKTESEALAREVKKCPNI